MEEKDKSFLGNGCFKYVVLCCVKGHALIYLVVSYSCCTLWAWLLLV